MFGQGAKVSLFGRFKAVPKRRLARVLSAQGAKVLRDVTRSSTHLVIGEASIGVLEAVEDRVHRARLAHVPVLSEAALLVHLSGQAETEAATLPLATVPCATPELAALLQAFGIITYTGGQIAFKDAAPLRTGLELLDQGLSRAEMVNALLDRRDSPLGRHNVVVGPSGEPMLAWEDGVTTLTGQQLLDLGEGEGLDDLFEQALEAEEAGDLAAAAKAFETCVQHDRKDALAAFNLGNVRRALGDAEGAKLAFQQAIARDPRLSEAHYNIAGVLEQKGEPDAAMQHLQQALSVDGLYSDALFNLGQLQLAAEQWAAASETFGRFIALDPDDGLAAKARQALTLIALVK